MKIASQSADEMVLEEGSTSGMVVGVACIIAGALVGYFPGQTSPIAIWIALGLSVVGIVVVLFSSSITVIANKKSNQISYRKKRLVGAQNATYGMAEIFRIETRKQWRVENTPPAQNQGESIPQPMLVAQSVIVFKDGRELALDHQKTSSTTTIGSAVLMGGQGAETAMASRLAEFLNVPFQEIMPPNMSSGLNIRV
jgi:hypothetical protein